MRQFTLYFILGFSSILMAQEDQKLQDAIRKLEEHGGEDTQKVMLLNNLAREYIRTDTKKSIDFALKAVELAQKLEFKKGEATVYTTLGVVFKNQGLPDSALTYHFMALAICKTDSNFKKLEARVLNNIGVAYKDKLDFKNAVRYYSDAILINEKFNDLEGLGMCNNNIGIIYKRQGQYEQALKYFIKAKEYHELNKGDLAAARSMNNIASIYLNMHRDKEALDMLKQAEKILLDNNDQTSLAILYGHFTSVYREQGLFDKAEEYCIKAGSYYEKLADQDGLASNYVDLAELYIASKRPGDALYYLEKGITIANKLGKIDILRDAYDKLAKAFEMLGDDNKAYDAHKKMVMYKDSAQKMQDSEQLNILQAQFDSDRKEKEIELFKQKEELSKTEQKWQRVINLGLTVGLLLVGILLFLVFRNYKQKQKANLALSERNKEIGEKNRDITDSIRYAKRLQGAILPEEDHIRECLPDSFVFYRSKDIVSGDLYWVEKRGNRVFFAAIDCTGHGVPGAFMSIMCFNLLKQSVAQYENSSPSIILDDVNLNLKNMLRKQIDSVHDGMDIALCCYDRFNRTVEYSGAYNPLWLVKGEQVTEFKPNRFSVGLSGPEDSKFTNHVINVEKGDAIYIFSDGYADQFGGYRGKKLMKKYFREFLNTIHSLTMEQQKRELFRKHDLWKGEFEQVDDIVVIGVRI